MSLAGRVLGVRRGEGRAVAPVVVLMFVAVAGLTLGESATGALFFDRVGADALPRLYVAQGAVGIVGMVALTAVLGRFERRRTYVALPVLLAILIALERAVLAADPTWIYATLWLTVTLANLVQSVFLWGTAALVTDTRTAKRLFPLFGAATILGAVIGGIATRPIAALIGVENLLVVWAVALIGSSVLVAAIAGVRRRGPEVGHPMTPARRRRTSMLREFTDAFAYVRRSPLLVWMGVASVLFSLLFYSLYLPYAQAAAERFPDPEQLAGFFGILWAAVTAGAFVMSLLATNRLLAWIGAAAVILILPILYAGAFGTLLITASFQVLVALRFGLGVWLQGASSPAWEAVVNVTPEHRRDQVRAFLNGGPAQAGTALAGVIQLVGEDALTVTQLSMIGLGVAMATIGVTWLIRRSYTTALVDAIRAGRPNVFDGALPNTPIRVHSDAQAMDLATATLRDPEARIRRLGAELLASADDARATDGLRDALTDADAVVRATATGALAARGALSETERARAVADPDRGVRLAIARTGEAPEELMTDPDPAIAAAAAGRACGGPTRIEALGTLRRLLASSEAEVRLAAVRELRGVAPSVDLAELVAPLAHDASHPVRSVAIELLARSAPEIGAAAALSALTVGDPELRRAALRALDAMPEGSVDAELGRLIDLHASLAARDRTLAASVPPDGEASDLLHDAVLDRGRRNAIVALSALSVRRADRDGMRLALENLSDPDPAHRANVLEAIEAAAGSSQVRGLIALWEPMTSTPPDDPDLALHAALDDEDPLIRASAQLVRSRRDEGGTMTTTSMSKVERVLVLRRIPLFAALTPVELQRLAEIAAETSFADGDVIAAEGELGEEMHIVLDGSVRVDRAGGDVIAIRGPGEVVGEMSIITRAPRVATLVAEGDVRTVSLDRRRFESIVRERPEIGLAVMRVLAERLAALTSARA